MTNKPVILWFRRDLRLRDNPALNRALEAGSPILPLFILDEGEERNLGGASRWWLDKALRALMSDLEARGARLILRRGDSLAELQTLIAETGADALFLNRRFEPTGFEHDTDIAHALQAQGVACHGFNGSLLCPPGSVLNGSGQPYKVFTPFMKTLLARFEPPAESDAPDRIETPRVASEVLDDWDLHPRRPDWSGGFDWTPGEAGALYSLSVFLSKGLKTYSQGRDIPGRADTSRLSAHLHWGEISPWRIVRETRLAATERRVPAVEVEKFVAEIVWRDFSAHLLQHFPYIADKAFRPGYDAMPWKDDPAALAAWRLGLTGYPLVDAGMRQLWTTGWMHNRVRMVVASFLVKHLMIDWREGEAWFWDTLVDADLASNVQNWQWVAGSGADAAPYFRIFNPTAQGQKFDADGAYVRRWVPELRHLPDRWIQAPHTAPPEVLRNACVRLGHNYPKPIVDHEMARVRALSALKTISRQDDDRSDRD
nr:deoxyribodipyrimidine photo-lyase [uncultured Brevundimonas sp.]